MRIERQLLCVRESGFLRVTERAVLEVEQRIDLLVGRSMPRSLRGV